MNQKRVVTVMMWTLAIVLPGGLALLALWLSFNAGDQSAQSVRNDTGATTDTRGHAKHSRALSWLYAARRVASR